MLHVTNHLSSGSPISTKIMIIEAQMIIGACDRRKKDENEKVSISNGCDFDQFVCFYVELGQSR